MLTLGSVLSANAALVHAGGNVTQVMNGVVIDTGALSDPITSASDGVTTDAGTFNPTNIGPGQQDFAVANVSAQYVRITVSDNFFGPGVAGGDRVGFNEFQFNTAPVPEPSSTALLGLGGLSLLLRRRR